MDDQPKNSEQEDVLQLQYPATVVAFPAIWNTFCYIVECEIPNQPWNKYLYFSEAAPGKPTNKDVGSKGFIYFQKIGTNQLPYWIDS